MSVCAAVTAVTREHKTTTWNKPNNWNINLCPIACKETSGTVDKTTAGTNGVFAAAASRSRNTVMARYHAGAEHLNLSCSTILLASPVASSLPLDLLKTTPPPRPHAWNLCPALFPLSHPSYSASPLRECLVSDYTSVFVCRRKISGRLAQGQVGGRSLAICPRLLSWRHQKRQRLKHTAPCQMSQPALGGRLLQGLLSADGLPWMQSHRRPSSKRRRRLSRGLRAS